jgi:hypothetical protein
MIQSSIFRGSHPAATSGHPPAREVVVYLKTKNADVAEHPKAPVHVGLLFNEPPGRAGLFFI